MPQCRYNEERRKSTSVCYAGAKTMLKLKTNEDIRGAIRRRGAEIAKNMSDKDIFTSPEFKKYATSLADFILRNHRLYSLDIQFNDQEGADVAYTDGKKIFLNVGNSIAAHPKLLERRFKTHMGILFHECAHKLFLDFAYKNRTLKKIEGGKLSGKFPSGPQFENAIRELTDVTANPLYSGAIANIYAYLANIIHDGHDEAAMKRCFPGFIAECITVAGEVQMETSLSLNEMIAKGADAYPIYCSLFLQYAKFGTYKVGDPTSFTEAYLKEMAQAEPIIDSALFCDDNKTSWDYINSLVIFLWPSLKKYFQNQQSQGDNGGSSQSQAGSQGGSGGSQGAQGGQNNQSQGGGGSSSSGQQQAQQPSSDGSGGEGSQGNDSKTMTAEELCDLLNALAEEARSATNSAPAPVNCKEKAVAASAVQSNAPPTGGGGIGQLLRDMTEKAAIESVQKELDQAQMDLIRNCNVPLIHQKIPVDFRRHIQPNKFAYDDIAKETKPVAKNLAEQMLALFRELNEEYVQHHKRFGPIIEAKESYRPDNTFFAKKKLPDDYPDMAVCILLDQSGSMSSGSKLFYAQRMAILMEQFASKIGVPIMIAGHSSPQRNSCRLTVYTDFVSAKTDTDRHSLGSIASCGCNRDGLAIRICAEMLSKRPEQVKLLVVISDGAPSDNGYQGENAREDISSTVKEYRRKGLQIYGAAIDDDKDIIEEIYGKGFLSIQNLSSLPKTMVRLVRQQIL